MCVADLKRLRQLNRIGGGDVGGLPVPTCSEQERTGIIRASRVRSVDAHDSGFQPLSLSRP